MAEPKGPTPVGRWHGQPTVRIASPGWFLTRDGRRAAVVKVGSVIATGVVEGPFGTTAWFLDGAWSQYPPSSLDLVERLVWPIIQQVSESVSWTIC